MFTDNTSRVLEWHQRHAIAIGTAKGLRFLHEECRGSPIIHRDMRPSNILLTCDFVPMVNSNTLHICTELVKALISLEQSEGRRSLLKRKVFSPYLSEFHSSARLENFGKLLG